MSAGDVLATRFGSIAFKRWGHLGGQPVLAMHGWLDNAASFDPLGPLIHDVDLVAIDLSGHGHSDHHKQSSAYHLVDWVILGFEVAAHLGWSEFSLLGHSLGGAIAGMMAGALPERIKKLILIDSLGSLSATDGEMPLRVGRHIRQAEVTQGKRLPIYPDFAAAVAARAKAGDLSEDGARYIVERGLMPVAGGVTWRSDPRLRIESPQRLTELQVLSFLSAVTSPTLVIYADRGLQMDPEMLRHRRAALAQATYVGVAGGHHVHMEDPQRCAQLINSFLAR